MRNQKERITLMLGIILLSVEKYSKTEGQIPAFIWDLRIVIQETRFEQELKMCSKVVRKEEGF